MIDDPLREIREEAFELATELDLSGGVRMEMLAEPERAVAVMRHAKSRRGLRNPAAFAVHNWRSGFDPRQPPPVERVLAPLPEGAVPSLSTIELAWSLDRSAWTELLLRSMSAAIALAGGFHALQDTFRERERLDELDELVSDG